MSRAATHGRNPLGSKQQALRFFSANGSSIMSTRTPLKDTIIEAAHAVHGGWGLSRLARVLSKLDGNGVDRRGAKSCCIHIMAIGGSVTCGNGHPANPARLHEVAGINHTWANVLVDYLDEHSRTCCPEGHRLSNLCQTGKGTDFFVDTFDSRITPAFHEHPADVVIVDMATNDLNAVMLKVKRIAQAPSVVKLGGIGLLTEALVRRLLMLSPDAPAILYTESAWFDPKVHPQQVWGGWPEHEGVLRHYGIPTAFWTRALSLAGRDTARSEVLVDALHPSRRGHQLCAFFLVTLLQAEHRRLQRMTADERAQLLQHGAVLPPTYAETMGPWAGRSQRHDKLLELIEPPLAAVDFTDSICWLQSSCSRTWRQAVPSVLDEARVARAGGHPRWEWMVLRRSGDGHYAAVAWHDPQATREVTASDKWGLMAHSSGATFVAHLNASRALRVGYLRSYNGIANVSVRAEPASRACHGSCSTGVGHNGVASQRFTLSRHWELNASIYASSTLRLTKDEWSSATPKLWRVTFTLQPGATSSFTIYGIKTW